MIVCSLLSTTPTVREIAKSSINDCRRCCREARSRALDLIRDLKQVASVAAKLADEYGFPIPSGSATQIAITRF